MRARIYKPSPNPLQSGKANSKFWLLVFDRKEKREIEPLMGYTSSSDVNSQIKMRFKSLEAAKAYAEKYNIDYEVEPTHEATPKRVSYTDNFRPDRKIPWTH